LLEDDPSDRKNRSYEYRVLVKGWFRSIVEEVEYFPDYLGVETYLRPFWEERGGVQIVFRVVAIEVEWKKDVGSWKCIQIFR